MYKRVLYSCQYLVRYSISHLDVNCREYIYRVDPKFQVWARYFLSYYSRSLPFRTNRSFFSQNPYVENEEKMRLHVHDLSNERLLTNLSVRNFTIFFLFFFFFFKESIYHAIYILISKQTRDVSFVELLFFCKTRFDFDDTIPVDQERRYNKTKKERYWFLPN